jgi:hypothetical protein
MQTWNASQGEANMGQCHKLEETPEYPSCPVASQASLAMQMLVAIAVVVVVAVVGDAA